MSKPLRIYIDTSVIGGCLDEEFKESSMALFEKFKMGEFIAVISEITELELMLAPQPVRDVLSNIPEENIERINLSEEAVDLAHKYLSEGVLNENMLADAQHMALATIHSVDVVVSWNFKHIVNIDRIKGFQAVNLKNSYSIIDIRSPPEVISYD